MSWGYFTYNYIEEQFHKILNMHEESVTKIIF